MEELEGPRYDDAAGEGAEEADIHVISGSALLGTRSSLERAARSGIAVQRKPWYSVWRCVSQKKVKGYS